MAVMDAPAIECAERIAKINLMDEGNRWQWMQSDQRKAWVTYERRQVRYKRLLAARKLGTHTKQQWENLKRSYGYRCAICGTDRRHLERDHIIPICRAGSSDGIENIQPVCATCNNKKGVK